MTFQKKTSGNTEQRNTRKIVGGREPTAFIHRKETIEMQHTVEKNIRNEKGN